MMILECRFMGNDILFTINKIKYVLFEAVYIITHVKWYYKIIKHFQ